MGKLAIAGRKPVQEKQDGTLFHWSIVNDAMCAAQAKVLEDGNMSGTDIVCRFGKAAGPVVRPASAKTPPVAITNQAGFRTSAWYASRAFSMSRQGITRVSAAPSTTNGWQLLASEDGQAIGTGKVLLFGRDLDAGEIRITATGVDKPSKVLVIDAQDRLADAVDWKWVRGEKTLVISKPSTEVWRQNCGPNGRVQCVVKAIPRSIDITWKVPAVIAPFYIPEALLGCELDDPLKPVAQSSCKFMLDFVKRGYIVASNDCIYAGLVCTRQIGEKK